MADSLLSAECLQALETARSWASALDWRRRGDDLRQMLSSITWKVNQLYSWESQKTIGLPKEQRTLFGKPRASDMATAKSGSESIHQKLPAGLSTPWSSISGEEFPDSDSGVSTVHPQRYVTKMTRSSHHLSSHACSGVHSVGNPRLQKKRSTSATSITSIRPRQVHLRDTSGSRLKSYLLYDDVELGLKELGHAMDVEMAAVPSNCREDDDVQTTPDVLALHISSRDMFTGALTLLRDTLDHFWCLRIVIWTDRSSAGCIKLANVFYNHDFSTQWTRASPALKAALYITPRPFQYSPKTPLSESFSRKSRGCSRFPCNWADWSLGQFPPLNEKALARVSCTRMHVCLSVQPRNHEATAVEEFLEL
ncbi:hypothetical protein Esti_005608 [Eimeria stiedai]